MKKTFRVLSVLLAFLILISSNTVAFCSKEEDKSMTILFTHDLHDHFYPFDTAEENKLISKGGYARLSTAIKQEKEIDPELILVDAGDFSMGTLFQTIFKTSSPALRIMGALGYDVTTFGNHEFDFRAEGLADSLNAAKNSGDKLPQLVASNLSFPLNNNKKIAPSLEKLKNSMHNYGVKDYTVIERNGIKIGIFGLLGKDAESVTSLSGVLFDDAISKSKEIVNTLKNEEKVDLIVCLSHSGTWDKKSKSEDEFLAKKVPDIDVIVSGHTHTQLEEPIIVKNTIICSSGRYGENLGKLRITQNSNKRWDSQYYELKKIDDSLEIDHGVSQTIDSFRDIIQREYLDHFNMKFDDVLAHTPFNITELSMLGKLIGNSNVQAVKKAEGSDYEPIAVTIVPYAIIRDFFVEGDIKTSQVFNVSPLGIGLDKIPGYPSITVYLTGKELKITATVNASIPQPELYMSGLDYKVQYNKMISTKITDVYLGNQDGTKSKVEDDKLYRVITSLSSAQMLSVVKKKSFGLLSIIPKTKDGEPITNYNAQVIYDGDDEVKEWIALADYLKSFPQENNIPQIPEDYKEIQSKKDVYDDNNMLSEIKSPNNIKIVFYLVIALIIAFIAAIIKFFIKRKK